ncbi:oligopeptide transporter 2-like [Silene latifolia]|uniref:oligopeptide transporter 2-like n=1 Tax=Silene latifolia TaxID=37657 RepID=UPI003D779333
MAEIQPVNGAVVVEDEQEESVVEQVRLTVSNDDDPKLPVWTFRMWFLGIGSCLLLSFLNTFFYYRSEPLIISMITVQVATLPIGRFMARVLPTTVYRIGSWEFSFNSGPFNTKEHVLISMFANAGASFGGGPAYAVGIVDIIKVFYFRKISFFASFILIITTQVLGYGWAGILRKYVVDPAEMWWPSSLVQVSLFRALHEKEDKTKDKSISRSKFFIIALICSFAYYIFPGFLFQTLGNISLICLFAPKTVTNHIIGSGLQGLGIGSFTFNWNVIAAFLQSPLVTPFFAIVNVAVGYVLTMYVAVPIAYWGLNSFNARTFPFLSSDLFTPSGQSYDITSIVNNKFQLDVDAYAKQGRVNLSMFFAFSYGLGFAAVVATLSHVLLFNGRDIYQQYKASSRGKVDIHTKMMKKYKDVPFWWFGALLVGSFAVSLLLCIFMVDEVQMPWWGLIFASGLAFIFTLPVSIITATTNQTPGINIITEYLMGLILPGRPIANVVFKTYGYISMSQAVSFLNDFKLGHYMKIPPRSMFLVQFIGTIIAGTTNLITAWWLLNSVKNICHKDLLPAGSDWTCPNDRVFFDASVIWGLLGPKRMFGSEGNYGSLNWFFLVGIVGPFIVWLLHKAFPRQRWIALINLPVMFGAAGWIPPASSLNYNSWIFVGIIFNFFVLRYRKKWWQKYNYVLSAALDGGVAFMSVLLYLAIGGKTLNWWGGAGEEYCGLAICPTAKGIVVDNCPVFQ